MLYGDSITDQRLYSTFIEEYVLTRFPAWKVQWTQSGVGGDKVSGGAAGPIDLRIQRDILPYRPTLVTIMLGMNDGYYRPPNAGDPENLPGRLQIHGGHHPRTALPA